MFVAVLVLLQRSSAEAQLKSEPATIDFGARGHNERPEMLVVVRNTGPKPVVVRELKRSCDCIDVAPARPSGSIPPNGMIQLRVSMGSGRAMGRLDKRLSIIPQDPKVPALEIPVVMSVLEEYHLEPFGGVCLEGIVGGSPKNAFVDLTRRLGAGRTPAGGIEVKIRGFRDGFQKGSSKHLSAQVSAIPLGQRITVEVDPRHPEGIISSELEAEVGGKALVISVTGEMFAWIKASPTFVNFSKATPADPQSTERELILESTDETPFRLLDITYKAQRQGEKLAALTFKAEGLVGPIGSEKRAEDGAQALRHRIQCFLSKGEGKEQSFFGTITVRTDHPQKPVVTARYSGFFLPESDKKATGAPPR